MSDELKACPFCGKFMYYEESASGIDAHCTNKNCLMYNKEWLWLDVAKWNTRPIEDALRAELAASQAEVERLRKSLALVDDALNSYAEFYGRAAGLAGLSDDALPSTTTDEIILRKIAEHDEVERLRGIIRKAEWCVVVLGKDWSDGHHQCPICECALSEGHDEECPFYQWEGGAK